MYLPFEPAQVIHDWQKNCITTMRDNHLAYVNTLRHKCNFAKSRTELNLQEAATTNYFSVLKGDYW